MRLSKQIVVFISLALLVACLAPSVSSKKLKIKQKKSLSDLSDKEVNRIYDEWEVCA